MLQTRVDIPRVRRRLSGALVALAIAGSGALGAVPAAAGAPATASPTFPQIAAAMAHEGAVRYSVRLTLTGIPGLTTLVQKGYASLKVGFRAQVAENRGTPVDALDTEWNGGRAFLYGNEGGLVLAGLKPARAAAEAGHWLEAAPGSAFARHVATDLRLPGLLSPYGPSGPLAVAGVATVQGQRALHLTSSAAGPGGSFELWVRRVGAPLPLEARARLVGLGSDVRMSMQLRLWGGHVALAPPSGAHPVPATWWAATA